MKDSYFDGVVPACLLLARAVEIRISRLHPAEINRQWGYINREGDIRLNVSTIGPVTSVRALQSLLRMVSMAISTRPARLEIPLNSIRVVISTRVWLWFSRAESTAMSIRPASW